MYIILPLALSSPAVRTKMHLIKEHVSKATICNTVRAGHRADGGHSWPSSDEHLSFATWVTSSSCYNYSRKLTTTLQQHAKTLTTATTTNIQKQQKHNDNDIHTTTQTTATQRPRHSHDNTNNNSSAHFSSVKMGSLRSERPIRAPTHPLETFQEFISMSYQYWFGLLWISHVLYYLPNAHCLSPDLCCGGDLLCGAHGSVPEMLYAASYNIWSSHPYARCKFCLASQTTATPQPHNNEQQPISNSNFNYVTGATK